MSLDMNVPRNTGYVGRFAPSPSGPLHFGSLVCALASYLDAKQNAGKWLVRIEDIDPPREQIGASDKILRCLEAHGLHWDGPVRYQSQRGEAYREVLTQLKAEDLTYPCSCTRKRLMLLQGCYDGFCRTHPISEAEPTAVRLKVHDLPPHYRHISTDLSFYDSVAGNISENLAHKGDFVIHRKDGLFAYQLAVVVDDIDQGISHVVRGDDLLDTTTKQIFLYHLLDQTAPAFAHIPVVLDACGNKLSKQNHAPAVDNTTAAENLVEALAQLGLPVTNAPSDQSCDDILAWAAEQPIPALAPASAGRSAHTTS